MEIPWKITKSSDLLRSTSSSDFEHKNGERMSNEFADISINTNQDQHSSQDESSESDSEDASLSMLGLTEDYFSHPGNRLGLSSHEELQIAIESCREIIMRLPETSKRREKLVERLVELRLKLQDQPTENEPNLKTVLGHQFIKQMSKTMKRNCDCCSKTIWGLFQMWYYCQACGFKCHEKCVGATRRSCVALAVKSTYQLKICPEVGLSNQLYSCAECKNSISITGGTADEARLCDYNGLYYCPNCHWNDLVSTPARVLHNWDHTPYKVSRGSYQLLKSSEKRALLEVREINPMLFNFVEELAQIRKLREDILKMKPYFLTCSIALELKLLCKLEDRQHFVDGSHMYSMRDLTQAMDGSLTQDLSRTHTEFAKHIKLDCLFCQAKGFVCEICNAGETLFPFDSMVSICPRCSAVFHSDCFSCIDTMCPRCKRKQQKKQTSWEESSSSDDDSIYSLSSSRTRRTTTIETSKNTSPPPPDVAEEAILPRQRSNAILLNEAVVAKGTEKGLANISPFLKWAITHQSDARQSRDDYFVDDVTYNDVTYNDVTPLEEDVLFQLQNTNRNNHGPTVTDDVTSRFHDVTIEPPRVKNVTTDKLTSARKDGYNATNNRFTSMLDDNDVINHKAKNKNNKFKTSSIKRKNGKYKVTHKPFTSKNYENNVIKRPFGEKTDREYDVDTNPFIENNDDHDVTDNMFVRKNDVDDVSKKPFIGNNDQYDVTNNPFVGNNDEYDVTNNPFIGNDDEYDASLNPFN